MEEEFEAVTPSMATLERTFDRMPKFLEGIAESEAIAAALATKGFTAAIHEDGWERYHAARRRELPGILQSSDTKAARAINTLDTWDEGALALTDATLARAFPAQHKFIRGGLKAATGIHAVLNARNWLERVDALAASPEDAPSHAQDRAAVAALATVGFTEAERTRLWALVKDAESVSLPSEAARRAAAAHADSEAQRLVALVALYDWFFQWSRIAHAVLTKKSHLIKLGLAHTG